MKKAKSIGIYFHANTMQIVNAEKQMGEGVGQCVNRLIQEGNISAHERALFISIASKFHQFLSTAENKQTIDTTEEEDALLAKVGII